MAEYGFDIVKEWDTVGARRLWVLIKGLSPQSALLSDGGWTQTDHLLAALIEATDLAGWRIWVGLGGDPKKADVVEVPRPERPEAEKPKKKITTDTREIAAWFAAHSGV